MLELQNIDLKEFALNLSNFGYVEDDLYDYGEIKNIDAFMNERTYQSQDFLKYVKVIFSLLTRCIYHSYAKSEMDTDIKSFTNSCDLNVGSTKQTLYNTLSRLNTRFIMPTIINFVDMFSQRTKEYMYIVNPTEEIIENYVFNFFTIFAPFIWPLGKFNKLPNEVTIHILVRKFIIYALYEWMQFLKDNNGFNINDEAHLNSFASILCHLSYIFILSVYYEIFSKEHSGNERPDNYLIGGQQILSRISYVIGA